MAMMKSIKTPLIIFPLAMMALALSLSLQGQTPAKSFNQEDVWSVFTKKSNKSHRDSLNAIPVQLFKPYTSLTPFIGYNPAFGMLIGVSSTTGIYLGPPSTTPVSSACVAINLTSKAQKIFNLRSNVITNGSQFIFRGDWRYLIFSQPTYGLGSGLRKSGDDGIIFGEAGQTTSYNGLQQPINYNYIRFYETFFIRLNKKIYAGIGYFLDNYTDIVDLNLNLGTNPRQITSHYRYSTEHGFNPAHQTISGLSLELLLDSRDNSIRPTKGYLANFAIRQNLTFLGSTKSSLMLNTEFRTYVNLSKRRPDHLVAFWYIGQFTQSGRAPYLGLPAIGWDMYNRTGRGFIQGSIRGVSLVYGETEYRFPISRYTGILGGVLFVNASTASSDDQSRKLFQYFDPAAGLGLRVMFSRKTKSNLTVDYAIGAGGSNGIYFNLNETF